jgi:RimJ/RimL family protein N-acetyltransferase
MISHESELPLGPFVVDAIRRPPARERHIGRSVVLEPLEASHAAGLWDAATSSDSSWTYLRYGPFLSEDQFRAHIDYISSLSSQPFFAIIPASSGCPAGWASFCDISPENASIEVGSIWFSPRLQRTRAGTEAMFIMLRHAFELGYHRLVWRCNVLNAASMRAAERLGFTFEGIWRGAEIAKGHRRDIAWFSILENEWPEMQTCVEAGLDDSNFDSLGRARTSLLRGLSVQQISGEP